jgi:putative polymerase
MSLAGTRTREGVLVPRRSFWLQPPVVAVIGATAFNFVLCLVNTNVSSVGSAAAIACELMIISTVLLYTYRRLTYTQLLVICGAVFYLVVLAAGRLLLSGGADVKPIRDLLIPISFFILGTSTPDLRMADRIVRVVALLVVAVGLFEYFLPDVFTRFCNIASFYVERGTMDLSQAQQSSSLFVSGMRPEGAGGGRNLLPFLGNHRVSSIFLEPVSAGNFGIIVFLWALIRSQMERRLFWGLFAAAAFAIVMSDSRFGAYFCAICLVLSLVPSAIRLVMVAVAPLLGLLSIVFLPDILAQHFGVDNGFIGRIIMSGEILSRFDALNWFGLRAPEFMMADSGYAYTVASIGVIGMAIFWIMLLSTEGHSRLFYSFRDLAAAYVAFLLCISNSPYTIKTGALLWFLAGVLSRAPAIWLRRPSRVAGGATNREFNTREVAYVSRKL